MCPSTRVYLRNSWPCFEMGWVDDRCLSLKSWLFLNFLLIAVSTFGTCYMVNRWTITTKQPKFHYGSQCQALLWGIWSGSWLSTAFLDGCVDIRVFSPCCILLPNWEVTTLPVVSWIRSVLWTNIQGASKCKLLDHRISKHLSNCFQKSLESCFFPFLF